MSSEICAGHCPKCGSPVEYDEETEICKCVSCGWIEHSN